jgi:molecular chaperone HtpG
MQKGHISVQTENIFPIIKQFLYSDQEIFLRELISNAVDATTKINTLASKGEFKGEVGDTTIEILLDKDAKTLTIRDRGIGMSEEEVDKYLNQVAFSGAKDFMEKYKDESGIIGHFGLGFYSAFMVADKVDFVTKSFQESEAGVTWSCEGNPEYSLEKNEKDGRGTDVVLHISDDADEYLDKGRIQELLNKYCKFLPVEIQFGTRTEQIPTSQEEDAEMTEVEVPNIVNNPNPIWKKTPGELTDEDYKSFYNELYPHSQPPLFWIHLNIDFPFQLTGILYFPKLNNNLEVQKNKIQLYSNQVFITDEVKEIVPEFLTLLHGVIDSPDIPLNVSRSYLQADKNVKKIGSYITKKVADKMHDMFKKEREDFEGKWDQIGQLVKYGMITDTTFDKKAKKFALLKNLDAKYFTIEEYAENIKETQTDKHDKVIAIYTNSPKEHDSFIQASKDEGYDVLLTDSAIDNHFMQHVEQGGTMTFVRVDSETVDNLVQKDVKKESVLSEEDQKAVEEVFKGEISDMGASVSVKALSPDAFPVMITKSEFMRRMKEMQAMQGMGDFPDQYNVVVNSNHPLIAEKLLTADAEEKSRLAKHLYNLALLNQNMLKGAALTNFIKKSVEFLK